LEVIGGDDETGATVPLNHELVEVLALLSGQALEAEIINYEKLRRYEATEDLVERVVGTGLEQFSEQSVRASKDDAVATTHRR
jgi:hypothetical protein